MTQLSEGAFWLCSILIFNYLHFFRWLFFTRGTMDEEEQFVNIDLNDDNICSVCKLETETGTLSFCHVCFELSIEGKVFANIKSQKSHKVCMLLFQQLAGYSIQHSSLKVIFSPLSILYMPFSSESYSLRTFQICLCLI